MDHYTSSVTYTNDTYQEYSESEYDSSEDYYYLESDYVAWYTLALKAIHSTNRDYELKNSIEWIPEYVVKDIYKFLFSIEEYLIDLS